LNVTGSHRVRRAAIAVVLVAALVLPASAPAGVIGYSGTFEPGGKLSFGLKEVDGKRYVTRWKWWEFPVTCANGEQVTRGKYLFKLRVRHRKFVGRGVRRSPSGRVIGGAKVRGEFGPGHETAAGSFRVYGRTPEEYRDCESGKLPWTATRDVTPVR
jgi:hypothetical protein